MANIKYNPNLFLETIELQRAKEFLDIEYINSGTGLSAIGGFRKNLLENSVSFGLVKNNRDLTFPSGFVQPDIDLVVGPTTYKTIKIKNLYAVDLQGRFIYQDQVSSIQIPSDNLWHWVRVSHQYSNKEKGIFSLSPDGTLTGTGGELTKVLRGGQNNFASKIRLLNSSLNTLDYEVLEVIDDNNCILLGTSFVSEYLLNFGIVGTFTPGVSVSGGNKMIFQYDSCLLEVVAETSTNLPPTSGFINGQTFYLARVKSDGTTLQVQDKRVDYWETKGSSLSISIERNPNTLIGVESVKWSNGLTPGDQNSINISWGLRCSNWNIDTNTNKLTFLGSVIGGLYRDIDSIPDNLFVNWRVYTSNGKYSRILSSTKSGSALNLILDTLNIDNYFTGGVGDNDHKINQQLILVPDAEEIELLLSPDPAATLSNETRIFTFPINTPVGECKVLAYDIDSPGLYNVKYRYKSFKEYTQYLTIPSNTVNGYYNEASFDSNGNIIVSPTLLTYVSSDTNGFIQVNLSPYAYSRFVKKVDRGDIFGVTTINSFPSSTYNLLVGTSENYLKIVGDVTLSTNTVIKLDTTGAVEGNEFRIHFEFSSFDFGGFTLQIIQGDGSSFTVLKNIIAADIFMCQNQEHGIVFTCVFDGTAWNMYQNYDTGRPNEVIDLWSITPSVLFDTTTKFGKVRGLYGYVLSDGTAGSPDLRGRFIVGLDTTQVKYNTPGNTGGSDTIILVEANLPPENYVTAFEGPHQKPADGDGDELIYPTAITSKGTSSPIDITPDFYTLIKAYKTF